MCWTGIVDSENLIALSSFFVAGASFWVSWLAYKRDDGRLDFYVGLGAILDGRTLVAEEDVIQFRIVNSGRRPLIVSQIGGDKRGLGQFCLRLLSKINYRWFQPRAYIINGPIVNTHLLQNGNPKVLNEGEIISFYLPLPAANGFLEQMAEHSASVYIYDTLGRKHKVPCRVLRKLRRDFRERQRDAGN